MEKIEENSQLQEIDGNNERDVIASASQDPRSFLTMGKDPLRPVPFSILSKIEEVDESRIKSSSNSDEEENKENIEKQSPHVMWKSEDEVIHFEDSKRLRGKERPKSANCIGNKSTAKRTVKRSSSATVQGSKKVTTKRTMNSNRSSSRNSDSKSNSESSLISVLGRGKNAGFRGKNDPWRDENSWEAFYCPPRPRSACGVRTCFSDDCCIGSKGSWTHCESNLGNYQPRKCRSNPSLTRSKRGITPNSDLRIDRFKRSLKLLGLEVTDFGIYESSSDVEKYQRVRWKERQVESTFSTKVVKRSISLDDLKEVVREAWLDDRLDISHRKLLAQAAYEEWYFKKAEEAQKKRSDEKMNNKIVKEKLENEFESRRMKAEEQFKKWIEEKRKKMKLEKKMKKPLLTQFRVAKTREEVEVAFQRWKKEKDKQKEEKHKLELKEKEKRMNVEKQKEEKRQMAERAFIEWKRKLEETEKKLAEAKLRKERRRKDMERRRMEQEKKTSFQVWKDMKDKELMMKRQEERNAMRIANALRSAQLEERMYEAEQAFEEWLEKLEMREAGFKSRKSVS